jgi:spore coat protein U-like protein
VTPTATFVFIFVIAVILANPSRVGAQPVPGSLELVSVTNPLSIDNQVFSEATGVLSVTVGHTGGPSAYFLTVSRGGSGSFDPREMEYRFFFGLFAEYLDYNVFTPTGEIARDLTGPISPAEVISGSFGNTGSGYATATGVFDVRIPAGQLVRRGTYRDEVVVSLYEGDPSQAQSATLIDQESVEISSTTSTVAQIAVSGQSQHTMDFGFLTEGAVRTADLLFRSNAAYRIDAVSENGGVMVNVYQPQSDPVAYQLRAGGSAVNLASQALIRIGLFPAGSADSFDTIPLSVTTGQVDQVLPGRFEDVITFTISTF